MRSSTGAVSWSGTPRVRELQPEPWTRCRCSALAASISSKIRRSTNANPTCFALVRIQRVRRQEAVEMNKPFMSRRSVRRPIRAHVPSTRADRPAPRSRCQPERLRVESPRASAPTRLFVCETLMAGERHHHLLGTARRVVERVRTQPTFRLLDRGGLADLAADGETPVLGEIYEVDPPTMAHLDRSFGHPRIYRRTSIELEDGTRADAYFTTRWHSDDPLIDAGDWRAREEAHTTWTVQAGDHEITGTRLEIVRALQDLLLDGEGLSMHQYIEWVVTHLREELGIALDVHGETDEQVADSYLKAMLRADLIRRC